MEPNWDDIEIRYCPVVGHNVAVQPGQKEPEPGLRCMNSEHCRQQRGGCRNRVIRKEP